MSDKRLWTAILLGGLVAGTIDIGSATLIYRASPVVILHSIASGLLGRASFSGGAQTAALGLFLQWAMSLVIAAIYVMAVRALDSLSRAWLAGGLGYGIVIFLVMNYIVVPLSAAMPHPHLPHFTPARFVENLLAMLLFGLIVAFFSIRARRLESVPGTVRQCDNPPGR